jgi:NAD(P)-dependent dehydrogenase (short-subunit alcohol dehydrogenase family)
MLHEGVVVVTGGGSGIGRSLCLAFAKEPQCTHVVAADLDVVGAEATAAMVGAAGSAYRLDAGDDAAIKALVERVEAEHGPIAVFVANAGIGIDDESDAGWEMTWRVNTMQHVFVSRHVVPRMVARGGGSLVVTASAAGLLTQIGSMSYAMSKAAAVSAAEFLAITHGEQGIHVSCLCPQAVNTPMIAEQKEEELVAAVDAVLEPEDVADEVVATVKAGTEFLILPHKVVGKYIARKTADYTRWIGGMQRLQSRYSKAMEAARGRVAKL